MSPARERAWIETSVEDNMTDERYKQLMNDVGLPNSRSLLQALRQTVMEATLEEREACAEVAERYEPDEKTDGVTYASSDIRNRPVAG